MLTAEGRRAPIPVPTRQLAAQPAGLAPAGGAPVAVQRSLGNGFIQRAPEYGEPARPPWMEFSEADLNRLSRCIQSSGPLHRADCYDLILGYQLPGGSLDQQSLLPKEDLKISKLAPWAENHAESFAVYVTDPELLRGLRPNVYAYFEKRYPR